MRASHVLSVIGGMFVGVLGAFGALLVMSNALFPEDKQLLDHGERDAPFGRG